MNYSPMKFFLLIFSVLHVHFDLFLSRVFEAVKNLLTFAARKRNSGAVLKGVESRIYLKSK
jgi:hypothetical protein